MIPTEKTKISALTGAMGKKVDEWSVWYSGDTTRIASHYSNFLRERTPNGRFWGELEKEERLNVVHEPLAADITQVSANLLFSEPADIQYEPAGRSGERITQFIGQNGFQNKLLEGAELAAAMGGVYLKLETDPDLSPAPMLVIRTPEMSIPHFKSGRLRGVTFWDVIASEDDAVYRLFESRQNKSQTLVVEYGLFKGTTEHIGQQVELAQFEQTKGYANQVFPNFSGLGAVYIPNVLPNRLYPGSSQGMADYGGCISLLDSLDETMTSWMRDLTLGQARIFADKEVLESSVPTNPNFPSLSGTDGSPRFDPFQRVYQTLDLSGWNLGEGSGAKPIEQVQFDIRVEEHSRTARELIEKIVSRSGYSPQSFGLDIQGSAQSGTALRIRERKSFMTQSKKAKYWAPQLDRLLFQMQQLDQATRLSGRYQAQEVSVVPADSIVTDSREVSETIRNLKQAEAVSVETSVKMAHPDWDQDAVDAEVESILSEQGAVPVPDHMVGA